MANDLREMEHQGQFEDIAVAILLQQLQGDDTLLLMYLVGELPPIDRTEVDRRLTADAKLRADLDRLTETYGSFTSGMEALDASAPMAADVSAAVRRASSAIRQWQARPALPITLGVQPRASNRWRVWVIPSAAAAIVLVVLGVSLYSGSNTKLAAGPKPSFPVPVAPVAVATASPDEVATVVDTFVKTTEIDPSAEAAVPTPDADNTHDESDSKAHEDGAVFNVPLPLP